MRFRIALFALAGTLLCSTSCDRQAGSPTSAPAGGSKPEMVTGRVVSTSAADLPDRLVAPGVLIPLVAGDLPEDNRLCYVCHQAMKTEELTHVHEEKGVLCIHCHGPSSRHMEDEMLMTEPDIIYGRIELEGLCRQCHGPHQHPLKVDDFVKEWYGRDRPNGRAIYPDSLCTDCHGTHNVAGRVAVNADKTDTPKQTQEAPWVALFNGKDLAGWKQAGAARWTVESGAIVGSQGADHASGDLLAETPHGDFLLTVTYRMDRPGRSGIWFRYQAPDKAYQTLIGELAAPACLTGSLRAGEKTIAICADADLEDRESWNTLSVRAEGDLIQVWLNGRQVAGVQNAVSDSGVIGIHVGSGTEFDKMTITIREALLQPLNTNTEPKDETP